MVAGAHVGPAGAISSAKTESAPMALAAHQTALESSAGPMDAVAHAGPAPARCSAKTGCASTTHAPPIAKISSADLMAVVAPVERVSATHGARAGCAPAVPARRAATASNVVMTGVEDHAAHAPPGRHVTSLASVRMAAQVAQAHAPTRLTRRSSIRSMPKPWRPSVVSAASVISTHRPARPHAFRHSLTSPQAAQGASASWSAASSITA